MTWMHGTPPAPPPERTPEELARSCQTISDLIRWALTDGAAAGRDLGGGVSKIPLRVRRRLYQAGLYRGRAAASGPAHDEPRWHPSDGLDSDPEAREHYSAGWRAGRAWRAESAVVRAIEGT